MNAHNQSDSSLRQALLDQIAAITTMQPGSLAEEYREHPAHDSQGVVRLGPYFKHQLWQNGRNVSRRVPAAEASTLKLDIENAKLFDQLTDQLAKLNFEHTLALRAGKTSVDSPEKKTSKPSASPKNTAKPSSSSPKRARNSSKRKNTLN